MHNVSKANGNYEPANGFSSFSSVHRHQKYAEIATGRNSEAALSPSSVAHQPCLYTGGRAGGIPGIR